MITLDTQVMVFDVLEPKRLSRRARQALAEGTEARNLACSDICLWEIAMLATRGKITVRGDPAAFIADLLQARYIRTLPITPEIAVLAQTDAFRHGDPADRLVAATALEYGVPLVTADAALRKLGNLKIVW